MRKRVRLVSFASFLTLFAMLLAACGGPTTTGGSGTPAPTTAKAAVTVGIVTDVGGLNDGGFNQFSHAGYEKARAQYGFPDVVIQSQVISDAEYTKNITAAAQQADMVLGVGFLMQNAVYTVAKAFPNKKFALIDGCATNPADKTGACVNLPNVAPLFFKEQEAGCLVGAIAGQMETDGKAKLPKLLGKNTISAVGGLAIPPVVRYIAGYSACGLGVLDSATKHNVYSIGVDVDQSKDSTGAVRPSVITSAVKRIDVAAYDIVNMAETGTYANFVASPTKFDLAHDGVGYATPSSDVPQDAVAKAMAFADMIKEQFLV